MSQFKSLVDAQKAHIKTLRLALLILAVFTGAMWFGWKRSPEYMTVHVPPDLRAGSTRLWWDIPPENVYGFGLYIFGQLHRWPTNGEVDMPRNLHRLQHFITPNCKATLEKEIESRRIAGELRNRVRGVYEILGRGYADNPTERVRQIDKDSWQVNLDITADEYYMSEPVKRALVHYPLRIVRYDINPELNPWGLGFDCYTGIPKRLEIEAKETKQ
ncbi:MAG: TIGR03746 family integrating conjugative element protein [Burkholderiales bacterium]|jgi:integrating conjugative element protein (TIGR03746 family)|nr:TIGR03746 family integrating conjugative element protein [Burkholderiales bacterium]